MESAGNGGCLVSVILPVRNEERYLGAVLDDLSRQTLAKEKLEIIVVDGMSTDATVAIAEGFADRFPNFQVLENLQELSSVARNIGYQVSRGEYIIIVDGHCEIPTENYLKDMVDLFEQHQADVLCRPAPLTVEPMTTFQRAVAAARASFFGHGLDSTIYSGEECQVQAVSAGTAYRRRVFEIIGLFDESFDACEDAEFNFRTDLAGLRAVTSPAMTIRYVARRNLLDLWRQLYRYGRGRWRLLLKHPSSFSPGALIPPALALSLVLLPLWLLIFPPIAAVIGLLLALYLLLNLAMSVAIAAKENLKSLPILPVIFATIHLALGFGFLSGVFRKRKN
ncbi:MAG: glycosyltransferase family 2 protein [candidate division Zixibacteria bacterium]|nr:glycosyltransferase family 2 protein [candidate division Zixibacteria bacterium]